MGVVETFELSRGRSHSVGSHETMAEASGGLPHGAYTSFRTYAGDRVVRLDRHVARLGESLALLGGAVSLDGESVRRGLAAALDATGHPESRVRLTFAPPLLFASVEPFTPLPASMYREGVACATLALTRENAHSKDTRFIATAAGAYAALPAGAHEGLLVADDGSILEGLTSNFFAVRAGVLHTEDARALHGITRSLALELLAGLLPVKLEPVRASQLPEVSECFLTSVSREALPAVRIDGRPVGAGAPGPVTRELMRRLSDLVAREAVSLRAEVASR